MTVTGIIPLRRHGEEVTGKLFRLPCGCERRKIVPTIGIVPTVCGVCRREYTVQILPSGRGQDAVTVRIDPRISAADLQLFRLPA